MSAEPDLAGFERARRHPGVWFGLVATALWLGGGEMMRRSVEQAEIQARAITENALHQHQETVMMLADRVHEQLGAVSALLWMSSQALGDSPAVDPATVQALWTRFGSGDQQAFARELMGLHFRSSAGASRELFFGTPVRSRHSETIVRSWERLLRAAASCDPDGFVREALSGSAHGTLYAVIGQYRESDAAAGYAAAREERG